VYHEDWSHNLQWCCDLASHGLQLFDSQSKLEDHLQEVHNEDVKNSGIRQLIERNKRPAPILWTECPFCKFVPDTADVRDVSAGFSQDELASKKLVKHIGHHLQAISILALPWRDDLKDDANSELNESSRARDREASSQLDESEFEETDHHDDEADYELDLRSVASTSDQRWDMDPAGFQETDRDDPVIQHLIFNQTDWLERIEDQFAPLGPGRIRLLRLHPGKPDEPIHCDRLAVSLQHPPAYKFLSYVWGDRSRPMRIAVGRELCNITVNLYSALKAIRAQDLTLTLWVDCLCINLENMEEKGSQVALMPQIARSASETIVWLGEGSENSDLAMNFVGGHNIFMARLDRHEIMALNEALVSLFAREWWARVWMVQEVILSKSVTVTCGSSSTPFEEFVHLRNFQPPQDYCLVTSF
jgi:Heterokaryon incompatibility protein (HET)